MTELRKADPEARRQALLIVVAGALVGVLCLLAIERYRDPLLDWISAEPAASAQRFRRVLLAAAALLTLPLLGIAAYLWALGRRIEAAAAFPPPGMRVIRDTPVVSGASAVSRGRWLKRLALICVIAALALGWMLWRLAP